MQWYQFDHSEYRVFDNRQSAFEFAIANNHAIGSIMPLTLSPYGSKAFYELLANILHHRDNQHSLQSALIHALESRSTDQRAKIILQQLRRGVSFGDALSPFTPKQLTSLFSTLRRATSEQPKLAALKSATLLLERELTLSHQLSKSMTYPFLIMQSALLMAFINASFNHFYTGYIGALWAATTLMQAGALLSTHKGLAAQCITRNIKGMRNESTLSLTLSMLETGESLQGAIKLLTTHSHLEDRCALHKTLLLLESGQSPESCLPQHWFIHTESKSINNLKQTADITTPLKQAKDSWGDRNQQHINLLCKAIPILGIVISSIFVAYTLVQLYLPLMELSRFAT